MQNFLQSLQAYKSKLTIANSKLNKFAYACWAGVCVGVGDDFADEASFAAKIVSLLQTVTMIAPLVAVAIIIYGGYTYILSAGDDGQIEKAQSTITAGVIGLVIVVIAHLIIRFVISDIIGA